MPRHNDINIKENTTMRKILNGAWCAAKWVLAAGVVVAAVAYAGSSDYRDAVVTEMKNNGTYYSMLHEHPDWTERQMVEVYEAARR